ncbi:MAG: SWIM zinc finger family protein, partial [Rhodocyclaceae bacterium]
RGLMGRDWYGGWAPYVPVAERRRNAVRKAKTLAQQGHVCEPITIEGRTIARSFWAKAWCQNLEAYSDFANRLPRGRTYVRNGSVLDLRIQEGRVSALVSGSDIYTVEVSVQPLEAAPWKAILKECAGKIGSLVELLQGRLSDAVMEVVTRPGRGLFPTPKQISVRCSCPDGAYMCKHVAATLYGVGARLDQQPELLFLLRHMNPQELIAQAGSVPVAQSAPGAENRLDGADLSSLFGIELDQAGPQAAPSPQATSPAREKPKAAPKPPGNPPRPPKAEPAPARKKKTTPPATQARTITAQALTGRGIPHSTIQNWLTAGVLLRTGRRGEYQTTAQTEARITQYLGRSKPPT